MLKKKKKKVSSSKKASKSKKKTTKKKAVATYYKETPVIGWREWVSLPELGIRNVKAKIDTGARTSAIHAYDVEEFRRGGKKMVRFKIHPIQRQNHYAVKAEAQLVEWRRVKDSGGTVTYRPVIVTEVKVGEHRWDIELTLVNRDEMGFRMLLGRAAVRGHLLVNPAGSYLLGAKASK